MCPTKQSGVFYLITSASSSCVSRYSFQHGQTFFLLQENDDYILLDFPSNDLTYVLIPEGDLTHVLIPNDDLNYEIL